MWKRSNQRKKAKPHQETETSEDQPSEAYEQLRQDVMKNRVKTYRVYAGY